jgi:hypothetical protein
MSHRFVLIFTLIFIAFLTGCETQQHVVRDTWGDFERSVKGERTQFSNRETEQSKRMAGKYAMQGNVEDKNQANPLLPSSKEFWAIRLASFAGMDQQNQAQQLVEELKRMNVDDAWMTDEDGYTHVNRGKFNDPTRPEVQSALRQSRMLKVGNDRPFAAARLVAARPALEISSSDMDLKRYRDQGLYSLQVAVFDEELGPDYKKYAEQIAADYRKDGDQAFFYHGKYRSMVTIGLFTYDQAWIKRMNVGDAYSEAVLNLQKKFPHNVFNGRLVIEKIAGKKVSEQSSCLVQVR